ncbi:S53 family peptidase [Sorangium sp. So ce233]|uniref:S53 family peptidase n=1 Tax=Sorangium sp. So ce233 TaxID=3133290 RepID=UPI003F613CBC
MEEKPIRCTLILLPRGRGELDNRCPAPEGDAAVDDAWCDSLRALIEVSREVLDAAGERARQHGLHIISSRTAPGELVVEGTRARIRAAFEDPSELGLRDLLQGTEMLIPDLVEVEAPRNAPHTLLFGIPQAGTPLFTAPDLARFYEFPEKLDGSGQKIGVILQGGGFAPSGLETYFGCLGLSMPAIHVVEVDGAVNQPAPMKQIQKLLCDMGAAEFGPPKACDASRPDWKGGGIGQHLDSGLMDIRWTAEGLMDVQILSALANGAEVRVYITANTSIGLYKAIQRAVDDGVSVLSCSFGSVESSWDAKHRQAVDAALTYAASQGVTVCFSSGNHGSTPDNRRPEELLVSYPGSSPWALCCGGTWILSPSGNDRGEEVWNEGHGQRRAASGGGFSAVYGRPWWQDDHNEERRRGVPDVASNAAFSSGVWLWFAADGASTGANTASTGTSSAAPVWAALAALINQKLERRLGFLPRQLYRKAAQRGLQAILAGNNIIRPHVQQYHAHPGWNACAGLGRPIGRALLDALAPPAPGT